MAALCLFTGCNKKAQEGARVQPAKPQPIVVKGLYIGMPVSTLESVVREKFVGDWKIAANSSGHQYDIGSDRLDAAKASRGHIPDGQEVIVWYDADGLVKVVCLRRDAVDDLFNAAGLSVKQFVQMFINAYNIPSMDYQTWDQGAYWEFVRDDVACRISTDKVVFLLKTEPRSEVQKNFN